MTNNNETKKIGVIVGREWSWPPAFIEEVNRRNAGVTAEFVKLGGTKMNEPNEYAVIIDRISHEIPYYRAYLKNAALQGTIVINNPFWWSADDKFTGASIADKLGIPHPKTVALPSHSYIEGVVEESLRNLAYPIPWEQHIEYLGGFPVILKPAWGGGFKKVYKLNNYEELYRAYNETGTECMMLQQYIEWEKYARCVCLGQEDILTIKFDANAPWPHRYFVDHEFLTPEEGRLVTDYALKICRALGYDMNTVEFAIKDGVPYAIDFTNPAPDFDVVSLTEHYFPWVVNKMADLCIDLALGKRKQEKVEPRWDRLLEAGMRPIEAAAAPKASTSSRRKSEATAEASPEVPAAPSKSRRTSKAAEAPAEAATKKRNRKKTEQSTEVGGLNADSDQVSS
ncbi:MAG TPA: hypothetical protein VGD69_16170 [Herpetosiphonaceae bacterium]